MERKIVTVEAGTDILKSFKSIKNALTEFKGYIDKSNLESIANSYSMNVKSKEVEFMAEPSEIGRPPQRGPVDGRQYRP
jgi:hypothetical protein